MLAYFSHRMYLPNVTWAKEGSVAKFCWIFPYDFDFCVNTLCSFNSVLTFDANAKAVKVYEYLDNDQLRAKYPNQVTSAHRSCCRVSYDCFFPFPLTTPRRLPGILSLEYKPESEQLLMISKPTELPAPLPKKWLPLHDFHCWLFKKIDKDRTFYCQVHIYNIYGYGTSRELQKFMIASRGREMQRVLLTFFKNEKEGKHIGLKRDDDFAKMLQACHVQKRRAEHQQHLAKQNAEKRNSNLAFDAKYL